MFFSGLNNLKSLSTNLHFLKFSNQTESKDISTFPINSDSENKSLGFISYFICFSLLLSTFFFSSILIFLFNLSGFLILKCPTLNINFVD